MSLDRDAQLLTESEEWCRYAAETVCSDNPDMDLRTALAAARWASMWLDDLRLLIERSPGSSREALKKMVVTARASSLARVDHIGCFSEGIPTVCACIAAQEVFNLAFWGEGAYALRLLRQN